MAGRRNYYHGQLVLEAELDAGFNALEQADWNIIADLSAVGVYANAAVTQHSPSADLTVDVSGLAIIYDGLGRRINVASSQNVNVAVDSNGASTTPAAGMERWVSIFVRYKKALSDPRIDGNSATVFFVEDESFEFVVTQGGDDTIGNATRPSLLADAVLLADIQRLNPQTQILTANISAQSGSGMFATTRRQDAFVFSSGALAVRAGTPKASDAAVLTLLNDHVTLGTGAHAASSVSYAGSGNWLDSTALTSSTVETAIDEVVSDLISTSASTSGAHKIGSATITGATNNIAAGSVATQLAALKLASNIEYTGGAVWANGAPNPATSVELQIDKIISDLAGTSGAARLGFTPTGLWADGSGLSATRVDSAINEILTDLANSSGALRVSAGAISQSPTFIPAGSIGSQLADITTAINARMRIASAETVTANHTYSNKITANGQAGDGNTALETTKTPTTRALLWEWRIDATLRGRFYADNTDDGFSLVLGASWNGSAWVSDNPGSANATRYFFGQGTGQLLVQRRTNTSVTWTAWNEQTEVTIATGNTTLSIGGGGVVGTSGAQSGWIGFDAGCGSDSTTLGAVLNFRAKYQAAPSSVTYTQIGLNTNVTTAPSQANTVFQADGLYVTATATTANLRTKFTYRADVS